jgi:hypothetical protein
VRERLFCFRFVTNCSNVGAICGIGFSIWGVITLIVVGILMTMKYKYIALGEICDDDYKSIGVNCFIAAAIYGAIGIASGVRLWFLKKNAGYETI